LDAFRLRYLSATFRPANLQHPQRPFAAAARGNGGAVDQQLLVENSANIASSADKIRLYLNGDLVASTSVAGWGNTVGQFADIAGGNDGDIAGKFAIDNLKVYDTALTDFSHRFNESAIPEPALAGVIVLILVPLRNRRLTSRAA
jgi:hypothetical protein